MGIRGAFSLLSNDPRRFGTPWLLNNNEKSEDESSCVFLDGPSLLYHISIEGDVYDHSPPLTIAQIHRQGAAEQASPAKIHTRITNFLTALLQVCSGHVRVVMDGLAPEEKIPTQVDRLRVMAIQGDKHATKPKSPCKLLHLLAESAMVEAVYHVAGDATSTIFCINQPAEKQKRLLTAGSNVIRTMTIYTLCQMIQTFSYIHRVPALFHSKRWSFTCWMDVCL